MKTLIFLLVCTSICFGRFKFQDWQKDKWNSEQGTILRYDKAEHLVLAAGLESTLNYALTPKLKKWAPVLTIAIGTMWEVRDGFVLRQGFSSKDLVANVTGVVISIFLRKVF